MKQPNLEWIQGTMKQISINCKMEDVKIRLLEKDSSRRVMCPSERPPPDNTQHSQRTGIHIPDGNRTCNPSKRAAVNPTAQTERPLEQVRKRLYNTSFTKNKGTFHPKMWNNVAQWIPIVVVQDTLPEGKISTFLRKYFTSVSACIRIPLHPSRTTP